MDSDPLLICGIHDFFVILLEPSRVSGSGLCRFDPFKNFFLVCSKFLTEKQLNKCSIDESCRSNSYLDSGIFVFRGVGFYLSVYSGSGVFDFTDTGS